MKDFIRAKLVCLILFPKEKNVIKKINSYKIDKKEPECFIDE